MTDPMEQDLAKRVLKLEQEVQELRELLQQKSIPRVANPSSSAQMQGSFRKSSPLSEAISRFFSAESILHKLGVVLLIISLAYLFKYSIDQGWLHPLVRIWFGLGLGVVLFGTGFWLQKRLKTYGQVLQGASIAVFFTTTLAAHLLYGFIGEPTALSLYLLLMLFSIVLALWQNLSIFSVLGILGAHVSSFLLMTESGYAVGFLWFITCTALLGAILHFMKGWKWTLLVSGLGGLIQLYFFLWEITRVNEGNLIETKYLMWLQVSVILLWIGFGVLPALRQILINFKYGAQGKFFDAHSPPVHPKTDRNHVHVFVFLTPIFAFTFFRTSWVELSDYLAGMFALVVSMAYLLPAFFIQHQQEQRRMFSTLTLVGVVMLVYALFLFMENSSLALALGSVAIALHFLERQRRDPYLRFMAHALYFIGVLVIVPVYASAYQLLPYFSANAAMMLLFIGITLGIAWLSPFNEIEQRSYVLVAHVLVLMFFMVEASLTGLFQVIASLSWGIYALVLIILGFMKRFKPIYTLGLITFFIMLGKVFLIDLMEMPAIWRVLLMMGFGGAMLLIGYFVNKRIGSGYD